MDKYKFNPRSAFLRIRNHWQDWALAREEDNYKSKIYVSRTMDWEKLTK